MSNITISISGVDVLTRKIQAFENKSSNWSQELFDIGIYLLRSQDLNFRDQGRPVHWRLTAAAAARNGMTLVDTGRLRRSVSIFGNPDQKFEVKPMSLKIETDVPYAKYLQEEFKFIAIQDQDIPIIGRIMHDSIERIF